MQDKKDLWLKQRKRRNFGFPDCWCPFRPPHVIVGMSYLTDECPGIDAGEFWYDKELRIHIKLKEDKNV
jgi:hypothetical protein